MQQKLDIIISFLFMVISISCAQNRNIPQISIDELKVALEKDSTLVILDVRTPEELKGPLGKIEGVINIPIQELHNRVNELTKYKERSIAVICRTDNRSRIGASILIENGFKAKFVPGGMIKYNADK